MNKCDNGEIIVSVICNTYNHEEYIADALESFVNQKTNFKFEVLVHDDCSTDATEQIIREYEQKYPNVIKGYYEKENQHSKGKSVNKMMFSRACGKYVAICEGDDFWCDENKLQIQVDYMEKNHGCSLCTHSTKVLDVKTKTVSHVMQMYEKSETIEPEQVILRRNDFATSSMLFRNIHIKKYPEEFGGFDYMIKSFLSCYGYTYYINTPMSVYRRNVKNSWTDRTVKDREKFLSFIKKEIDFYNRFNEFSKYRFKNEIDTLIRTRNYRFHKVNGEFGVIVKDYSDLVKKEPFKRKIHIYLSAYFPWSTKLILRLKKI